MQVWLIDKIDLDDDRETFAVAMTGAVARKVIARQEQADADFCLKYNVDSAGYRYETWPVDVYDESDFEA